jgi:hypothetical protein
MTKLPSEIDQNYSTNTLGPAGEILRRRLINFGIFSAQQFRKAAFSDDRQRAVYLALLDAGFKPTRWQYVFDGQIAGLIKSGINDVHIRFYPDRLFAEIEISRALISHFYGPRYNAKKIILECIKGQVGREDFLWAKRALNSQMLRTDEAALKIWDARRHPKTPYEEIRLLSGSKLYQRAMKFFVGLDWQKLGMIVFIALSMLTAFSEPKALIILLGVGCALYFLAPKKPDWDERADISKHS